MYEDVNLTMCVIGECHTRRKIHSKCLIAYFCASPIGAVTDRRTYSHPESMHMI